MTGQSVMLALILCFLLLPLWQIYRWQLAGRTAMTWHDVGWLLAYLVIGFSVLFKLRPILILGVQ